MAILYTERDRRQELSGRKEGLQRGPGYGYKIDSASLESLSVLTGHYTARTAHVYYKKQATSQCIHH